MDDVDQANDRQQRELEQAIHAARGEIPPGVAGECETCGEWSARLIDGMCASCRDRYHPEVLI